jgi:hypothetical protein
MEEEGRQLLGGAVDMHIHSSPSMFPRALNDLQAAQKAADYKMKAIVLKAHEGETVGRAQLVNWKMQGQVQVLGGIVLNHYVGGLNPFAVEASLKMDGKIIWMPTIHAANHLEVYRYARYNAMSRTGSDKERGIQGLTILTEEKVLKKEVKEILALIADFDACLATGHLYNEEILLLCTAAKLIGVNKILVNHPDFETQKMSIELQSRLAGLGCFLEKTFLPLTPVWFHVSAKQMANSIKLIGTKQCILSSDLGQENNLLPIEGLGHYFTELLNQGFTKEEIKLMSEHNPARLLNL